MPTTRDDLLLSELRFVAELKKTASVEVASSHDHASGLAQLSERLTQYELRLQEAMSTGSPPVLLPEAWDPVTVASTAPGRLEPEEEAPDDQASSGAEPPSHTSSLEMAHISDINKICNMMQQSEALLRESLERQASIEMASKTLRLPAEEIVENHIRLLRQYNEVKDVGQQIIGMIADNRGVPIASLYQDEEFGLTADD